MVSFEEKVLQFISEYELIQKGDLLLIACSGGIDSMALLHLFLDFRKKLEIEIIVAHVDHMLRGNTSYEDRLFVENFCKENGVEVFSKSIPIPKILEEEGGNSQAVCRRERYAYFAEVMEVKSITKLVTAHHADDQLESVLMSLTRAGSLTGMKGIYAKRSFSFGEIIRPFLSITKNDIREYINKKNGTYREDSSNSKDDYTRNRFRHHIIPLLQAENESVSGNAVKLAIQLQEDDDYLLTLAKNRFQEVIKKVGANKYLLDIPSFQKEPVALQRRIILILLNYIYENSNYSKGEVVISSIINLLKKQDGSASIHLPGHFIANRRYFQVLFSKLDTIESYSEKQLYFNNWNNLRNGICLYIGETSSNVAKSHGLGESVEYYCNSSTFKAPYYVRARKEGDRIAIKGMNESKRLSRLFIDEKIPLQDRDHWPVLVDANDYVMAVIGLRVDKNISKIKRPQDDIKIVIEYNNI